MKIFTKFLWILLKKIEIDKKFDGLYMMSDIAINKVTEMIIGSAYDIANELGHGFLEKVYENSLCIELKRKGLVVEQQKRITVLYKGDVVGEYIADILINDEIIVELKTIKSIENIHIAQCINYLKATDKKLGLILNFGNPKVEIKRIKNDFKGLATDGHR